MWVVGCCNTSDLFSDWHTLAPCHHRRKNRSKPIQISFAINQSTEWILLHKNNFSNLLARFRFPSLPELSGWVDGCGGPCPSHLPTLLHHQLIWLNHSQAPQTRFPTYNSQPVGELVSLRVSAEQAPPTRKMAVEVISGVFDPRNYKVSVFCLVLFLSVFNWVVCWPCSYLHLFYKEGDPNWAKKRKSEWLQFPGQKIK